MKATGIVRRIDDLGRVVIPKEIRRTMRIREGDPSQTTLTRWEQFCFAMEDLAKRQGCGIPEINLYMIIIHHSFINEAYIVKRRSLMLMENSHNLKILIDIVPFH